MSDLDAKGRCCGRKPFLYKTPSPNTAACPFLFCSRCDRAFNAATGKQCENWAYSSTPQGFVRRTRTLA